MIKPLCVIPARGGSKRLKRKNIALLDGKPLVAYTIEAALQSEIFEQVCVSTEDEEIADLARHYGAKVPFMRPPELATDTTSVVQTMLHALDFYTNNGMDFDTLGVLLATAPLRISADIKAAYQKFIKTDTNFLMAVTDYIYSPFQALHEQDGYLKQFWDDATFYHTRSQDLPKVTVDNGSIYLMDIEAFRREKNFYGKRLTGFYMPLERSVDIDDRYSFELATFFLQRQHKIKENRYPL